MAKPIEEQNLSLVFFVLGFLFFVTIIYMVYDEAFIRRPWKDYQEEFYQKQVEKMGEDLDAAQVALEAKVADASDYVEAKAKLEELNQTGSETFLALEEVRGQLEDQKIVLAAVSSRLNFAKADYDATRYEVEQARLREAPAKKIEELEQKLAKFAAQTDEITIEVDKEQQSFDEIEAKLLDLDSVQRNLTSIIEKYEEEIDALRDRRDAIQRRYLQLTTAEGFEEHFVPKPEAIKQVINDELGVVDRCTTCHMGVTKVGFEDEPHPHKTHPHVEELLIRNHAKIGCSPCHHGRGRALTEFTGHGEEKHWLWPMKGLQNDDYVEATCRICHDQQLEIPHAPVLSKGLQLIDELACYGCHPIDGFDWERIGPALNQVAAKTDFSWLVHWIEEPKDYLPRTRMPHFYLDRDQSRAVAAYLVQSSSDAGYAEVDAGRGDADNGEVLVNEVGCLGCHSLEPKDKDNGPMQGPNLTEIGSKTNATWLYNWLKDPRQYHPEAKMPNLRLTDQEALDITAYLVGLNGQGATEDVEAPEEDQMESLVHEGEELIKRYGCFGCHHINGFEGRGRIGEDLSAWGDKDVHFLDFGHQEIPHTREAWLFHKVKAPRIYDEGKILPENDKLRMPNFELKDDEIHAVVVALTSYVKEPIPDVRRPMPESEKYHMSQREADIVAGQKIIEKYNCIGCHQVERRGENEFWGGDIQAYIEDPGYHPPILYGEGQKVQPDWLYNFLKNVKTIRPWMKVRMPSFPLTDEEALALVKYFVAMDEAEYPYIYMEDKVFDEKTVTAGMYLFKGYQCISCHVINDEMIEAIPDKSTLAPNLSLVNERLRYDWLHDWIVDPNALAPGTKMPGFFPDGRSYSYMMIQQPQNEDLKAWFDENYSQEEQEELLGDTDWAIGAMQDFLWNFDADSYLAKFPWTPPAISSPAEEDLGEEIDLGEETDLGEEDLGEDIDLEDLE